MLFSNGKAGCLDDEDDVEASTEVEWGGARVEIPVVDASLTEVDDEATGHVACSGGVRSFFTWWFKLPLSVKGREHTATHGAFYYD